MCYAGSGWSNIPPDMRPPDYNAPCSPVPTISASVVGQGAIAITATSEGYTSETNGSYLMTASNGKTCRKVVPKSSSTVTCTFARLDTSDWYTFTVTGTNFLGTSEPATINQPILPRLAKSPTLVGAEQFVAVGNAVRVAEIGSQDASTLVIDGHSTACSPNGAGQCLFAFSVTSVGKHSGMLSTGALKQPFAVWAVNIDSPTSAVHGKRVSVILNGVKSSAQCLASIGSRPFVGGKATKQGVVTIPLLIPADLMGKSPKMVVKCGDSTVQTKVVRIL